MVFLALYPVTVKADGTIGETDVGGSAAGASNYATVTQEYEVGAEVTFLNIIAYFKESTNARVAIYNATDDTLLVESDSEAVTANAWHIFDIEDTIYDGTTDNITLGMQAQANSAFAKDNANPITSEYMSHSYGAFPETWSKTGDYTFTQWSIYTTYVSGAFDETAPSVGSASMNTTIALAHASINATVTDTNGVDYAWVCHNATGSMTNQTAIDAGDLENYAMSFTLTNPTECTLAVQVFGNDTYGNEGNNTLTYFSIVTYTPPENYLHVEGNQIIDENGNYIKLEGVNVDAMLGSPYGQWYDESGSIDWNPSAFNKTLVDVNLAAINSWNATVVRLLITVQYWIDDEGSYIDNIKYIAESIYKNYSMHMSIVPWRNNDTGTLPDNMLPWEDDGNGYIESEQDFKDFWSNVTSELKDYSAVIFEPWNEPNGGSGAEAYLTVVDEVIDAARISEVYNPFIIEWDYGIGYDYNPAGGGTRGDMTWVTDYPVTDVGTNLIMSTHVYSSHFYNSSGGTTRVSDYDNIKAAYTACDMFTVADNYPVWIGEHGYSVWASNATAEEEYFDNILRLDNETDVTDGFCGFAAWIWRKDVAGFQWGLFENGYEPYDPSGNIVILYLNDNGYALTIQATTGGFTTPPVGGHLYAYDQNVTLTATASSGYNYVDWEIDGVNQTASSTYYVVMDDSHIAKAYFRPDTYAVTLTVNNPTATTYTSSSVPINLATGGNETSSTITWNIQYSNGTWLYGTNKTYTASTTATITASATDLTFCAKAVGAHGTSDYVEVVFNVSLTTSYSINLIVTSPSNTTYTRSAITVSLSTTGNDLASTYNWNIQFSDDSWVYLSNQTSSSATVTISVNDTFTFYCTVTGVHGSTDSAEVMFSTLLVDIPALPSVSVGGLWTFLYAGDVIGFIMALLATAFTSLDIAVGTIAMVFLVPLYIRTKSLLLVSIAWILVGGALIAVMPIVSIIAVLFMAMGIGGLIYRLFRPSSSY